jgi:hypothetical protein
MYLQLPAARRGYESAPVAQLETRRVGVYVALETVTGSKCQNQKQETYVRSTICTHV